MYRLIRTTFVFVTAVFIGLTAYATNWYFQVSECTIPRNQAVGHTVTSISLDVNLDRCAFCVCPPSYRITFSADYRNEIEWRASKVFGPDKEVVVGEVYSHDIDQLAHLLETQRFFDFVDLYPEEIGCLDCVRTTISVLRDGKRTALTYSGGPPEIGLWTIEKAIQGVSSQIVWRKVKSYGP